MLERLSSRDLSEWVAFWKWERRAAEQQLDDALSGGSGDPADGGEAMDGMTAMKAAMEAKNLGRQ